MFALEAIVRKLINHRFAWEGVISYILLPNAGIAQLVERNLAKVDVAGSNPVSRSVPATGQGTFGNRAEGPYDNTSSLKWPRRPQSHQVAGFLFFFGVSVMWGCSKVYSGRGDIKPLSRCTYLGAVPKW